MAILKRDYQTNRKILYPLNIRDLLRDGSSASLFFRHSERYNDGAVLTGNDVRLTRHGVSQARNLGKMFKDIRGIKAFSSPVHRCMATIEAIQEGAGIDPGVETSRVLGDPGVYYDGLSDIDCGEEMKRQGFMNYAMTYLDTWENRGSRRLDIASEELLHFLCNRLNSPLTLFCTHDFLVAALLKYLGIKEPTAEDFVDFLEGVALVQKDARKIFFFRFKAQ